MLNPSHSSDKASNYTAEPPGTSVYDSEAPSDLSHSKSHPDSTSIHASQQSFNLTLRPDPTILGTAKADAAAASTTNADANQNEPESSASSASFTNTEISGKDAPEEEVKDSTPSSHGEAAKAANEPVQQPSIVHQTSGIRYLLDQVTEKVTDAFTRHQPRATPRPTDVSEDQDDEAEEAKAEESSGGLTTLKSGNVGR